MAQRCKVCAPLVAMSVEQMVAKIDQAKIAGADLVELRVDHIKNFNPETDLPALLNARTLPAIVTYRPTWEGGQYVGDEAPRLQALHLAADLGAEYVDVELQCATEFLASRKTRANQSGTKFIVSNHNYEFTPTEEVLGALYIKVVATGADIVKLVTTAQDITDVGRMMKLQSRAQIPTITLVMGPKGVISRILAPKFGGFLTFGTLSSGQESAPGQPTLADLINTYRIKEINVDTKVYGIIGNPVGQSKGPYLHNPAFAETGHNSVYVPLLVDNLAAFLKVFDSPDFAGFSVTIPFKEDAVVCADEVVPLAKDIGAVNTLVRKKDGKFVGYNTDCDGALSAIEDGLRACGLDSSGGSPLAGKTFVVIGAGGAGKALAFGAKVRGATVIVANRNFQRAQELAALCGATAVPLTELASISPSPGMVLANSTSLGMHPKVGDSPLPDKEALKNYALVFDAVYNPVETRLLREAKEMGAAVVSGNEMFIRQAIGQFEHFTEGPAPRQLMRSIIEAFN
ncbi:hypothetical protein R1flu_000587 [Riccia fluitans]|uniref:shikimate dehydrogenase (NADP(+)) n=1 Tax=Riccia fluitans TaxID=41844 RepID=A0ABD1Y0X3_9MARC